MLSAPVVFRATTVILLCAGGLAACSGAGAHRQAAAGSPSPSAVVRARYAASIDLDHGGLLVSPPPAGATATVPESEASAMFEATDAVEGPHAFAILGLGTVTVAASAERAPPPAPSTPPPSTTVPLTTVPTTTVPTTVPTTPRPSTTVPATTTTGPTASTTAPASAPGAASSSTTSPTTPAPALPSYRHRLAWVGIAWGTTETCSGTAATQPPPTAPTTYVAVLIDAHTGQPVLAYRSGSSSPCGGGPRTPRVSEPNELVSVPWQPVGPASTAVQIEIPPCGRYYGWTQVPTRGTGIADQLVVAVPFDPVCGVAMSQRQLVDQVIPLGPGQILVGHAPLGPIRALQTLPTS